MPEPTPRIIYEFGPFRLDFQRHAITKSGQPVSLPPKAFDILVMLLDRRDTLVSKTDLLNHIWPNSFVEENNLAQHVSLLRKTLGEAHGNSRYIETVPRVGYRFVGEVRLVHNGHENGAAVEPSVLQPPLTERPQRPAIPHRILRPLPLLAVTVLAGLLVFFFWPNATPAVLDYAQLTHDGYPKRGPMMTDRGFVYFTENRAGANTLVRLSRGGGEPEVLPGIADRMQPLSLSGARHELLAVETGPTGAGLPLWVVQIPAGGFRRLGSMLVNSAAWSPGGERIFYGRGRKLSIANSDGSDSRELLDAPGSVSRLFPSPDGRVLAFEVQRPQSSMAELWEVRLRRDPPSANLVGSLP